jgi:polyisoprenoid-binding protein YceI
MKNVLALAAVLIFGSASAFAQTGAWNLDRSHSAIKFNVSHMVISDVDGKFGEFDVKVLSDKEDFSDAKIEVSIKTASINTDDAKRDEHLRSADFFDAATHPAITFKSKKMTKTGNGTYKLTGDFTMRGVTKTVDLDVKFNGQTKSPWGTTVAGFKITGKVNRKEYGVSWSKMLDNGGAVVGDEVQIAANVELIKGK